MMITPTGIAISFAGSPGGAEDSRPVVARIVGFASGDETGETIVREMVVPAGEVANEELPHGLYNVQLTLPSGRILQRNVTIDDDTHETYRFFEDFAPNSGFSLQEATGRDDQSVLAASADSSGNSSFGDRAGRKEPTRLTAPPPQSERRGWWQRSFAEPEVAVEPPPPTRSILYVHEGIGPSPDEAPAWKAVSAESAIDRRGDATLWRIMAASYAPLDSVTRRWAKVVLPDGGIEVASLPLPWYCPASGEFSPADVLVDPARGGAATCVAVRDGRLTGLLSYLDRGQASSAGPLLQQLENDDVIEETIRGKMGNPLAACAAAYVGLAVYDPGEHEVWDAWLGNCMNRFPDVPDAAIVHARRLVLRPTGPGDNARAADALRRASAAGIPYFSAGVALLREMLTVLSPDFPDLAPLAERAARLSSRVDPSQAFTVLRYAAPRESTT